MDYKLLFDEAKKEAIQNHTKIKKSRRDLIKLMGGKCCKCGFSDIRALQIDHVNSDGYLERAYWKKIGGYSSEYYLNNVEKSFNNNEGIYQLLCANCNWIKRAENLECARRINQKMKSVGAVKTIKQDIVNNHNERSNNHASRLLN